MARSRAKARSRFSQRPARYRDRHCPKLAAVPGSPNSRHRFEGWSDGGSSERTIAVASQAGATLTAQVSVEHRLAAITVGEGRVTFDPPSDDSFYAAGSVVRATAQPDEGWEFVAWTGDVDLPDMREVSVELTMEGPHRIGAVFSPDAASLR